VDNLGTTVAIMRVIHLLPALAECDRGADIPPSRPNAEG
jgi:hypothetical protein